jgi:hypothetical protein
MADEKVTRRQLALAVAGALPVLAQTPPADEDLNAAVREQVQRNRQALAKIEIPIMLEPSFAFRP